MTQTEYEALYYREVRARSDTMGRHVGAHEAALAAVVNAALEEAAQICESCLTGHPAGGPDAARRGCIVRIRSAKREIPPPTDEQFGYQQKPHGGGNG